MRKSAGFTLIELVIVIIILGILGAVAAPRLFNLQGDAYGANLNAMKSSISTAATMANAKAQISGKGLAEKDNEVVPGYKKDENGLKENITFVYGYPIADKTPNNTNKGILATLDGFEYDRYNITDNAKEADSGAGTEATSATLITIAPKSIEDDNCIVTYTQATKDKPATVTAKTDGC